MSDTDSDPTSETSTLLDHSAHLPSDDTISGTDDVPILQDALLRHVVQFKLALAPFLIVSCVLDALLLQASSLQPLDRGSIGLWKLVCHGVALACHSFILLFLLLTFIRHISVDLGRNLSLHRDFCQCAFLLLLLASLVKTLPWASFVLTHHHGPVTEGALGIVSHVIGLLAFVLAGCIRRGPYLRYDPAQLGTGFGVGGSIFGEQAAPGKTNVLDWNGCSMLSYVTLFYNAGVAVRSTQVQQLEPRDVPFLENIVRMQRFTPSMLLDGSTKGGKVTEWRMLVTMFWPLKGIIFECWLIETAGLIFGFVQIAAIHELIGTFDSREPDNSYAYLCCIMLFVSQIMATALSALVSVKESYQLAEPLRCLFYTTLFRKILRTSDIKSSNSHNLTEDEREQNKGRAQILNLINGDVFTVAVAGKKVWHVTNAFGSLFIGTAFLYYMLGVSALIGIASVLLAAPFSYWLGKTIYKADRIEAKSRDARISAFKEFLDSIKVIKLNGWEDHFIRRIERLRHVELYWIRWRYHLGTCFNVMSSQIPLVSLAAIFYFHTYVFGNRLDPATAFVAYNVFDRVKGAMSDIPSNVQVMLKTRIALQRIIAFLNQDDVRDSTRDAKDIRFDKATLTWPAEEPSTSLFRLRDVDVHVPSGFTLVCGPLGSGKTLLLQAILGEAIVEQGNVVAPRSDPSHLPLTAVEWTGGVWTNESMAYAPQVSYIRHGTIRENVVFGQPFWEERYWEVLRQCGLEPDLKLLEEGDMTEVGEGGVTLSGGQKARINLARCIYSRARTVLLDDVLSAVDAHTAQHIFTECLTGPLLKDRTLVLVTHQVGLCLSGANYVISLRDGRVEQACNAREAKLIDLDDDSDFSNKPKPRMSISYHDQEDKDKQEKKQTGREIYVREKREVGHVNRNHYVMVLSSAGGWIYWGIMISLVLGARGVDNWRQYVLKEWTEQLDNQHLLHYLPLYIGVTGFSGILGAARWVILYGVGNYGVFNRACRVIHKTIFDRIAGAPLRYFDTTPKGRLLNVFTSDMGKIDGWVADATGRFMFQATQVATSVGLVCFLEPRIMYVIAALILPFRWANSVLRKLRADIRRLHAICESPLASLYTDSIDGVIMIRAFGLQDLYNQSLITLKDQEVKVGLLSWFVYLWARVIINSFSALILMGTGFLLVNNDWSAAQAGFILTFAMMVTGGIYNMLEQASDLEQTFVSAERLNHYMQMDTQESSEGIAPPEEWPQAGAISITDLQVRYSEDLPPVLHGIDLEIGAGERVGLVGATGSGKSTLALSIFRGNQQIGGSIKIDGLDIGDLTLKGLRSRLNMVVQESTLCSGTLRDALDISGERDDHEVYEALRRVHLLDDDPKNQFADLDTFVAAEGANFSQGQRQLMCLARALLKQSKVLVMDEATSSVDYETDAKITATINECFSGVTMLVIAHRLATIMHYDQVVVLDAGRILEKGRPAHLIADTSSRFHSLCQAQGVDEFNRLLSLCKK